MQPRPTKLTIKVKGKVHEIITSSVPGRQNTIEKHPNNLNEPNIPSKNDTKEIDQKILNLSSSENSPENKNNEPQNQLVVYDHSLNGSSNAIEPVPEPVDNNNNKPRSFSKPVPIIGTFTVQCAKCFKWRLIPTQERYEKIRENITIDPFLCETAREWNRDVSCDDPTDIEQDGTRIWAIDKPDIAQPPPGWKRLLRIRSEGSSKFADVYYKSPKGAKLRSMPDVERYLQTHPELAEGVRPGQFSFQIPKPLRDNYVRKRSNQVPAPETPGSMEPSSAEPIAWAGPDENSHVQIVEPLSWAGPEETTDGAPGGLSGPYTKTPDHEPANRAPKKARSARGYNFDYV